MPRGAKPAASSDAVAVARISSRTTIITALLGLVGGVVSILLGQYVVKSQRPTESGRTQAAVAEPGRPQAPSVTYWWLQSSESKLACQTRAQEALKQYGASVPANDSTEAAIANFGDYGITVLCLSDASVKTITVYGPDSARTRVIADEVKGRLQ